MMLEENYLLQIVHWVLYFNRLPNLSTQMLVCQLEIRFVCDKLYAWKHVIRWKKYGEQFCFPVFLSCWMRNKAVFISPVKATEASDEREFISNCRVLPKKKKIRKLQSQPKIFFSHIIPTDSILKTSTDKLSVCLKTEPKLRLWVNSNTTLNRSDWMKEARGVGPHMNPTFLCVVHLSAIQAPSPQL